MSSPQSLFCRVVVGCLPMEQAAASYGSLVVRTTVVILMAYGKSLLTIKRVYLP